MATRRPHRKSRGSSSKPRTTRLDPSRQSIRARWRQKCIDVWCAWRHIFKAWVIFAGVLMVGLVGIERFLPQLHEVVVSGTAWLTAAALQVLGISASVDGVVVRSSIFSAEIIRECTAVLPAVVFVAAVVAFPTTWYRKLLGIGLGLPLLLIVNLFRLVSLFFIGHWFPSVFKMAHLYIWQGVMILLVLVLWMLWIDWVRRYEGLRHHAA